MTEKLVLGIVGTGRIIQQAYLPILPLVDSIVEVWVYDLDKSKSEAFLALYDYWLSTDRFVAEYGKTHVNIRDRANRLRARIHVADSMKELLAQADAILVTTPPRTHLELAQSCLDAGKVALIEKPLATSSLLTREFELKNLARLNSVRFLENYVHNPAFAHIKSMLDERLYGNPLLISVFLTKSIPKESTDDWRLDRAESGGGVLSDWGSHTYGLALYLAGEDYKITSILTNANRFLPTTSGLLETYALTTVFGTSGEGQPLTLLIETHWKDSQDSSVSPGLWASTTCTAGNIRIDQELLGESKQYRISTANHHHQPISTILKQTFLHDSFYHSLRAGLQASSSSYVSFNFGQKLMKLIEEGRTERTTSSLRLENRPKLNS